MKSDEDGRPYSLRSIDSHDLTGVRPAFRLSDKSGTHGILEYIFPFFGVVLVAAQKMIVKSWLPEGREFLASNLQRLDRIESKARSRARFNPLIHPPNVVVQPIPKHTNR